MIPGGRSGDSETGRKAKNGTCMGRYSVRVTGAQSYWGQLGTRAEHTSELSHPAKGKLGDSPTDSWTSLAEDCTQGC